jgi:hypothetical protein
MSTTIPRRGISEKRFPLGDSHCATIKPDAAGVLAPYPKRKNQAADHPQTVLSGFLGI